MFQLSFSGTCAHSAALCSSVGVLQGTSELADPPPMSYPLHTKSLDTCAKCCLSVHGALIFLVAFHYDALRGSDSTDSTDYGPTKSFQENFLEMSWNCIFKSTFRTWEAKAVITANFSVELVDGVEDESCFSRLQLWERCCLWLLGCEADFPFLS